MINDLNCIIQLIVILKERWRGELDALPNRLTVRFALTVFLTEDKDEVSGAVFEVRIQMCH